MVRTRPNELSYIDGSIWKDVYGFRSGHTEWFKGEEIVYVNGVAGLIGAQRDAHRRFRRSLAYQFSNQGLKEQAPRILQYASQLVAVLANHGKNGPVDIVKWFSWTTTDVITDLAFGDTIGCLSSEKEHHFLALTFKILRPALLMGVLERWNLKPLAAVLLPRDVLPGLIENMRHVSDKVEQRLAYGKDRGDFFDRLLKHDLVVNDEKGFKDTQDGQEGFTVRELESNAHDIVFAGSETTATLLSGVIFHLLLYPDVYAKLSDVVRSAFASDEEITVASTTVAALPYLDAVLQETTRINDPVPLFAPRVSPKGGDTIGGVFIPEGTRVHCAKYIAYRSEYNFARPLEFIPERWLPVDKGRPEGFENDNRNGVFQPFSSGPRNCIGMNLAKAEMHLILAKLLWHFDFSRPEMSVEENAEWERWVERNKVWFLWSKVPLMVNITPRQK